ncbi:ATP-binding cassette sub-family D member 4-like isoform X2 [Orbicella faveolata]|uniref:ATP-binding cassette sub-family D member 4-like isoform X1 n=1 Tax=Orbicella faveolata TaxID=48498 RepID=UPI0009E1B52F|nr:ATP-binding cassette sub-family D member 4-like isoform X1 [Orbicella faveolata]XP_020629475.1 ATP-binding cassette sub-family D member 4-like isoform X2 [Orbicella faveolata]
MLVYNTGLIPSRFYEILLDSDKASFKSIVIASSLLILGTALADSAVKYDSRILYVKWRGLLDRRLHSGYFKHKAYYKLNVLEDKLDNIDQRITQDVDKFCESFRSSIIVFIISPFTIAYYTYQCYKSSGYLGPVCIYSYFILGTIINKVIITPIVSVVVKQEKLEGDFRFKHMQIRSNAESIAFYRSGDLEMNKTNSRLQSLLQTQLRLVNLQCILVFVVNVIDYVGAILSYLIIAIALFGGKYDDLSVTELGAQISRNSFFAMYLINCGTKLIDLSNSISNMAGYVHRIGQLLERFATMETDSEEKTTENEDSLGAENSAPHGSDAIFKLVNVSYAPPNCTEPLVKDLDLEVSHGKTILITGTTGSGKSSLFRILCGIWSPLSGEVLRFLPFSPKAVLFLPQKSFLTDGTLRQQLMYPCEDPYGVDSETGGNEDEKLLQLLDNVGLTTLCARVGGLDNPVDSNWEDMLSPGEMQRLSFARLFFHRPLVALLDEATSALDVASETRLYSSCKQLGITVVSVGHRKSLRELHDFILKLDGEGGWEFKKIKDE